MLMPKKTKYRKQMRGRMNGTETRGTTLEFGEFGLQTTEPAWITSRQIEAARRVVSRAVKRGGNLWIKIFPDKPVTAQAAETRMGSGKGSVEYWAAVVKPGRLLFELGGVPAADGIRALELAAQKLPVKTRVITK